MFVLSVAFCRLKCVSCMCVCVCVSIQSFSGGGGFLAGVVVIDKRV